MNTTPLTPPPAEVPSQAHTPQTPAPRARASWITPVIAIVGSLALLFAIATAVFVGIRTLGSGSSGSSANVQGVDRIVVDVSAADFSLEYGATSEAYLEVQGSTGWRLDREGDTLRVRPPLSFFHGWWFSPDQRATLTLPSEMKGQGLDAVFVVNSGSFTGDGDFGDLSLQVNAGGADLRGSAVDLDVTVNAGGADVDVRDVANARFDVNAGRIRGELHGSTPGQITVDVSAGELDLRVPDDIYRVTSNISAGSFDGNGLQTASASPNTIDVSVSAGSATVRPGG